MPECLRIFNNEKIRGTLLLPQVDLHWIVKNYVKLLDTFFSGYWNDFVKQNVQPMDDGSVNPALFKVANAYGHRAKDLLPEDEDKIEPMVILQQFLEQRLDATTGDNFSGISRRPDARLAYNDFYNLESRQENSLKYLAIWSEAFVITSLVWTFAPILTRQAKKQLNVALKERILGAKSDFGTYQKLKKKQAGATALQNDDPQKNNSVKDVTKNGNNQGNNQPPKRQATIIDGQMLSQLGKNRLLIKKLTRKLTKDGFQRITPAGFTTEFDDTVERPLFISDFPFEEGYDIYDCYFNLDSNQWAKHDLDKNIARMQI